MGMVYDPAEGKVVLFGGFNPNFDGYFRDTWTWDGSDWTKEIPEHSPSNRAWTGLAYDDATGDVVLFGGGRRGGVFSDTWTWDGIDWRKAHPAHRPPPRAAMSMSYDVAEARVVLFSGYEFFGVLDDDTWTWDGTDWTQQSPAHSPPAREFPGTAYDTAADEVTVFGGFGRLDNLDDTWTWDGTDWTKQHPAHAPPARRNLAMTYDASTSTAVLFGGGNNEGVLGDTWTSDGTDWTQRPDGAIKLSPASGPAGTSVQVRAWGFEAGERVRITFVDSSQSRTLLAKARTDDSGAVTKVVTIPAGATLGRQRITARGTRSGQVAKARFNVT
jgi:hypothetical protein